MRAEYFLLHICSPSLLPPVPPLPPPSIPHPMLQFTCASCKLVFHPVKMKNYTDHWQFSRNQPQRNEKPERERAKELTATTTKFHHWRRFGLRNREEGRGERLQQGLGGQWKRWRLQGGQRAPELLLCRGDHLSLMLT